MFRDHGLPNRLEDMVRGSEAESAHELAQRAAVRIAALSGVARHDVALVLGSGWAETVTTLGDVLASFPARDVPGFFSPTVAGHTGNLTSVRLTNGRHLLVMGSRTHLYEGRGVTAVAHGVRTAHSAGASTVILTNGAGSLRENLAPGDPVLISDHLNLTGHSPLTGPEFVDMRDAYSATLRSEARRVDPSLAEAVYAQCAGPTYETPAESEMLRRLGADLVGMSTALETIAARALGMSVLGISLVTNSVGSTEELTHAEVLRTGEQSTGRLAHLLSGIIESVVS